MPAADSTDATDDDEYACIADCPPRPNHAVGAEPIGLAGLLCHESLDHASGADAADAADADLSAAAPAVQADDINNDIDDNISLAGTDALGRPGTDIFDDDYSDFSADTPGQDGDGGLEFDNNSCNEDALRGPASDEQRPSAGALTPPSSQREDGHSLPVVHSQEPDERRPRRSGRQGGRPSSYREGRPYRGRDRLSESPGRRRRASAAWWERVGRPEDGGSGGPSEAESEGLEG